MSTSESELIKIETFVLKVNMNCEGCMNKVRKLLRKIEGVYKIDINAEEQKVTVAGSVNPSTLIQRLAKFGKHAEIWNAGYNNQELVNHVKDKNKNQAQYPLNDMSASENQHMIPTFGREDHHHWGPEWFLNKDIGAKAIESEINQHLMPPLFLENVTSGVDQNFPRINGNHKWEESMIPMMSPASFQKNNGAYFSGLGNQEWGWNLLGRPSISQQEHQPSMMTNIHGYYHNYHPSKMMQLYHNSHLPRGINIHMQKGPTTNDMMNGYKHHHHMTNHIVSSLSFNFDSN